MDSSWQGGFSQQMQPFDLEMDGSQAHEDWEDWLRWDPASAEVTSPENGTFNSGSSKNDSPLQEPPYTEFGHGDDEPLVPPLIVGGDCLDFGTDGTLANEPYLFGLGGGNGSPEFGFDQTDTLHSLRDIPKLDTNIAAWPVSSGGGPELSLPLSALSTDQPHQLNSAVSLAATTPSQYYSPETSSQNQQSTTSDTPAVPKKRGGRKRKAETQLETNSPELTENGEIKTCHNVIEKRYRNNLNDKIVELRNSVPSLRAMGRANGGEELEDLQGLTPAHKLNKATVMAKATEYIRHLEKRNETLLKELASMKAHSKKMDVAIDTAQDRQASISNSASSSTRSREASSASQAGVPNFLSVPQEQPRFSQPILQQQYAQQQGQPQYARSPNPPVEAQNQQHQVHGRGGTLNKVLLGTMTGLMIFEGFSEQRQNAEEKSLGAVPVGIVKRALEGGLSLSMKDLSHHASMPLLKVVLVVGTLLYLLKPLLSFSPRRKQRLWSSTQLPKVPSLASPVEVRRKAWDTAIQIVWVPKHFLLEVVAVGLKMLQLSLRRLMGSEAFTDITGTNKEEEAARIKAWDIAIDAQLAGGDAQVSYYRLLLTLMESGTLPDSPARLMQKAVHFRVFFWEVANAGYGNMVGFKQFTERVGKFYWDSARRLQKDLSSSESHGRQYHDVTTELLPDHLARLVELDCEEVLSDDMIQRAWNLAWNKASAFKTIPNTAKDNVVEDHSIRSPLDAVAAWYTNTVIDETLADALSDHASTFDIEYYLGLALSVAPPASSTHVRALTAKAVLSNSNRESNIVIALDSLPVLSPTGGMNLVSHAPASPDVCIALTLAKLISLSSAAAPRIARERVFDALRSLHLAPSSFTLLTSVATYRFLRILNSQFCIPRRAEYGVEDLAASLRVWVGTSASRDSGLGHEGRSRLVRLCLQTARQLGGWEKDSGYGSAPQSHSSSPVRAKGSPVVIT